MLISGLQKLTLLDFPGKLAATVFLGGCNFRCPFCHNASLVLRPNDAEKIEEETLLAFLKSRVGKLEGVCITGGEPTLYPALPALIKKIKDMSFLVKLDTNGTNFAMLSSLVSDGLVDYVAMDIKNSKQSYAKTAGLSEFNIGEIEKSVAFLLADKVDYEFRTTVVRELHTTSDIAAISEWISGAKRWFLQSFKDSGDLIGQGFSAYSEREMQGLVQVGKVYVPNAQIRG